MVLLACLALFAADDTPSRIFKWKDAKGNLFITDRLENVPAELRPKFAKQMEEAKEKKKKHVVVPVQTPPPPPAEQSAYQRLKERERQEKDIKDRSLQLRVQIATARSKQTKLAEEKGYLASNPVLNAAQPGRVQRMHEIDSETQALDKSTDEALGQIKELVMETAKDGYPEEWATGED